jgi:hypothetical protein
MRGRIFRTTDDSAEVEVAELRKVGDSVVIRALDSWRGPSNSSQGKLLAQRIMIPGDSFDI